MVGSENVPALAAGAPLPAAIPAPEIGLMIQEAGATLRPGSTAVSLADELAFCATFLTRDPAALDPNAKLLTGLTSAQKKKLARLRNCIEEAARIFASDEPQERVAGRRWLFSLNKFRAGNGWPSFLVHDVERLLTQMHLSATDALNNPHGYFRHYVLSPIPASERILKEKGENHVQQMIEDVRDFFKSEPRTRALLFIGRAIGCHIQDQLLGVVPRDNASNMVKGIAHIPQGPALRLGQAIAVGWGMERPGEDQLRTAWRQLPEKQFRRSL